MKQSKANNFKQALKELKELDPQLAEKLNEEINHCDRTVFHIMTVKIETIEGQVKNNVNTNIVKLHQHGFDKLKKNLVFQGITKLIVVHDPSQLNEAPVNTIPAQTKEGIEAKVKRELKAKHDAEIAEVTRQAIEDAKDAENEGKEDSSDEMVQMFNEVMTTGLKADLIAFGVDYGIEGIEDAKDNDARKAILKTWFESQN